MATQSSSALPPRRILLLSLGGSPAVLTETLYGLIANPNQPFIPSEIHVFTTTHGKKQIENLIFADPQFSIIHHLYKDYLALFQNNKMPEFTLNNHVHVFKDPTTGEELEDTLTPDQCNAAADLLKKKIFEFQQDPQCTIHCSLAGGRKTMSFFIGYLFSLGGQPQDKLSHTLIEPKELEFEADFYYPKPNEKHTYTLKTNHHTIRQEIPAEDIKIHIVDIPYAPIIRDRAFLNDLKSYSYSDSIKRLNTFIADRYPVLNFEQRTVKFGDQSAKLTHRSFTFYCALLHFESGIDPLDLTLEHAKFLTQLYIGMKPSKQGGSDSLHSIYGCINTPTQRINHLKNWASLIRTKFSNIHRDLIGYAPPHKKRNQRTPYYIPNAALIKQHNAEAFKDFEQHIEPLTVDAKHLLTQLFKAPNNQ